MCGGADGIRTRDLLVANETRYQLRYSPSNQRAGYHREGVAHEGADSGRLPRQL